MEENIQNIGRQINPTATESWAVSKVGSETIDKLASSYSRSDLHIIDNNAYFIDKIRSLEHRLKYWEHGIRYHFRYFLAVTILTCGIGYIFGQQTINFLKHLPISERVWGAALYPFWGYSIYSIRDIGKLMFRHKHNYTEVRTIREIDDLILSCIEPTQDESIGSWYSTTDIAESLGLTQEGYPIYQLGRDLKRLSFKYKRSKKNSLYLIKTQTQEKENDVQETKQETNEVDK